ncbi:MAG: aldo/keto reductase [Clostridiales bacterium]|nr:aldo/keto reductase [Clostridiales bacterium]
MPIAPTMTLNNGNKIPALGMGAVFLDSDGDIQKTVDTAIDAGYRLFDNAAFYGNEESIGKALKNNGIAREELFISTKLKNGHHKFDDACRECESSMRRLRVDYLDMYLIHFPCPEHGLYTEAWRALEHLHKEGLVRNIGVSNFHESHIDRILDMCEFVPAVDQLEFNPYLTIKPLREYLTAHKIVPEAWFPLGGPAIRLDGLPNPLKETIFTEPVIVGLADKYNRTPAQIILRWETQCGVIPVPKSSSPVHMRENINIFDFYMTQRELDFISGLNTGNRCGPSGDDCNEYWD